MMRSMLRKVHFWIALISLLAVAGVVFKDMGRTAPGPLSRAHQNVSELNGWNSCKQCHGGWFGNMTASCLECHDVIQKQIDDLVGFHGRLTAEAQRQCALCHSDHHGSEFRMVNRQSFAQAGFASQEEFKHDVIGYRMYGKHLEQECNKCHENADVDQLEEGQTRFLGLDKNCTSCHEDHHEGKMKLACASCHGQVAFDQLDSMDHGRHLELTGAHGRLDCRKCHAKDGLHSLETIGGGGSTLRRYCQGCHESPHSETFLAGNAVLAGLQKKEACKTCHSPAQESFRPEGLVITAQQHALGGFRLTEPHDKQACADCHDPTIEEWKGRHPGRRQDDCRSCHEDPHGGQFDEGHQGLASCLDCHERTHFDPTAFDLEKHEQTKFPLTGKHRDNECQSCHEKPAEDQPRRFQGTPTHCDGCHKDSHDGFFADRLRGRTLPEHGSCELCHDTAGFSEPKDFDHLAWTGFRLEGAHAQARCEACHERTAEPDEAGRTFGRISVRYGKFKGCVTCHEDPHKGQFDKPGMPKTIAGKKDCARCHSSASFRTLSDQFDHRAWSGFALTGTHAKPDCTACHEVLSEPNEFGRTLGQAPGKTCASCHESPHGPQFEPEACSKCHAPATSFKALIFDHDLHSRFKLGEQHAKLACDKCHHPEEIGGKTRIRYRPIKSRCVDCHPALVNPFKRRKR